MNEVKERKGALIAELVPETDPILQQPTEPWDFDKEYERGPKEFAEILKNSMNHYGGIGLSANQIGASISVFAMKHEDNDIVMFNPKIINTSEEKKLIKEGCLSFPGLYIKIVRPEGVTVQWQDEEGNSTFGSFIGMSARCILHEYDHLRGTVYTSLAKKFHLDQAKSKRKIIMRKVRRMK
jgi:peptide deformylase|tara:strand:- start:198 stop:740 length:543 start_codon:yes stop_codon:yes gene_type:complete